MPAECGLDAFSTQPLFHCYLGVLRDMVLFGRRIECEIACRKLRRKTCVILGVALFRDTCDACPQIGQLLL
jgi:hypothetical protein